MNKNKLFEITQNYFGKSAIYGMEFGEIATNMKNIPEILYAGFKICNESGFVYLDFDIADKNKKDRNRGTLIAVINDKIQISDAIKIAYFGKLPDTKNANKNIRIYSINNFSRVVILNNKNEKFTAECIENLKSEDNSNILVFKMDKIYSNLIINSINQHFKYRILTFNKSIKEFFEKPHLIQIQEIVI